MTRDEIALRLFVANIAAGSKLSIDTDMLGENQIRVCFMLADNFRQLARETSPDTEIYKTYLRDPLHN